MIDNLELWRSRLAAAYEQYGSLQHPEVLAISTILDDWVLQSQQSAADHRLVPAVEPVA